MEVSPPKTVTAAVHRTNPGRASDSPDLYDYFIYIRLFQQGAAAVPFNSHRAASGLVQSQSPKAITWRLLSISKQDEQADLGPNELHYQGLP